jgi:hypothetical protein
MPWLLLLVVLPGLLALFKADDPEAEQRAAVVLTGEIAVGAALYIAHILGAF